MSLRASILLAALFSLGAFTMAAPTSTTSSTTLTTSTSTSTTTPSNHHLHAYLTTVALLFEKPATPTPIHYTIVERRNDPHIRIHKDGSLYSDSNTITTTTTTHHNKNNKNTMMKMKKNNKKEHIPIR